MILFCPVGWLVFRLWLNTLRAFIEKYQTVTHVELLDPGYKLSFGSLLCSGFQLTENLVLELWGKTRGFWMNLTKDGLHQKEFHCAS